MKIYKSSLNMEQNWKNKFVIKMRESEIKIMSIKDNLLILISMACKLKLIILWIILNGSLLIILIKKHSKNKNNPNKKIQAF